MNDIQPVHQQEIAKEMGRIAGDKTFIDLLKQVSEYEVQTANVIVQSDVQEKMAVSSLGAVRTTKKEIEALRKQYTTFPLRLKESIDALFKQIGNNTGKVEKRLTDAIQKFRRAKEAEHEKKVAEEKRRIEIMGVDDAVVPNVPKAPENVTMTEDTALYEREVTKFEIVDEVKLIRAALNNNVKVIPPSIVTIDEKELRSVVTSEQVQDKKPSWWKTKGVRVWKEKVATVRTR